MPPIFFPQWNILIEFMIYLNWVTLNQVSNRSPIYPSKSFSNPSSIYIPRIELCIPVASTSLRPESSFCIKLHWTRTMGLDWSHLPYYGKTWNDKKYPFANGNLFRHLPLWQYWHLHIYIGLFESVWAFDFLVLSTFMWSLLWRNYRLHTDLFHEKNRASWTNSNFTINKCF